MKTYQDMRNEIIEFLNNSDISPFDLVRIGKDLCCCRTCVFFVQHYSKEGDPVDFGHCIKNNNPKPTRPHNQSCGFWTLEKEN